MNILEQARLLEQLPDAALQREMQQPTGSTPSYLVVTEIDRRNKLRQGASVGAGEPPTVASQVTAQINQQQPVQTQQTMAGARSVGIAAVPGTQPPPMQKMAGGGIVAFKKGGEVCGYAGGGLPRLSLDEEIARELGYKGGGDSAAVRSFLATKDNVDIAQATNRVRSARATSGPERFGVGVAAGPRVAGAMASDIASDYGNMYQKAVSEPVGGFLAGVFGGGEETVPAQTRPPGVPDVTEEQRAAAQRRAQRQAAAQAQPPAAVPPAVRPGLAGLPSGAVTLDENVQLPRAAATDPRAQMEEARALYGADPAAAALQKAISDREAGIAGKRKDAGNMALIKGGLDMMSAASRPGATFFGSAAEGAKSGLAALEKSGSTISAEEDAIQQARIAELSRQRGETVGLADKALARKQQVEDKNAGIAQTEAVLGFDIKKFNAEQKQRFVTAGAALAASNAQHKEQMARLTSQDQRDMATAAHRPVEDATAELKILIGAGASPKAIEEATIVLHTAAANYEKFLQEKLGRSNYSTRAGNTGAIGVLR